MFTKESRYYGVEDATLVSDDVTITYKKRRFLPDGSHLSLFNEITISAGDRLDRIAAKLGADPEQYWRICDANNVMHPLELTNEPGTTVKIARVWS
jgi:hypothetical protein